MNNRRSRFLFTLLAAVMLPVAVSAQHATDESLGDYVTYGDPYFFEVSTAPGATPGRGRAMVLFRLSFDFLTFRRVPPTSGRGIDRFEATPSVFVEAVAADGVIADRALWRDTVVVDDFNTTNAKTVFVPGTLDLSLRPGLYTLRLIIGDDGPGQQATAPSIALRMDDFGPRSPAMGAPLFLRRVDGDTLVASAIGGGVLFGERLRLLVPIVGAHPEGSIRYDLVGENRRGRGVQPVKQSGLAPITAGLAPGRIFAAGQEIALQLEQESAGTSGVGSAIIDARIDDLEQGTYTLVLSYTGVQGAVVDSLQFALRWIEQPVSLYRSAYAVRALFPIAAEATVDSMLGLDQKEQEDALRLFWEERDPTPSTRYNEAMAEYYRRVDFAYFNFRSVGEKDGVFTDRGKIYILFGPPTDVDRSMQPDSHPREVWSYQNRVARTFVFIDESKTGEYRLVEFHDL